METIQINHWAVLACAALNLLLGALWYSPALFYKAWMKENHFTADDIKKINPLRIYGITCLFSIMISYNLAFFLGGQNTTMAWGLTAGFLAGLGFAALIFMIVALFEQRSWRYMLINGGYMITYFTLAGLILGAWR